MERLHQAGRGEAVETPLEKTFFAEWFGTLTDRSGLSWMVIQS